MNEKKKPEENKEVRDFYEEEQTDFLAPCNTCKHRFLKLDKPGCPCLNCIHYISSDSQ